MHGLRFWLPVPIRRLVSPGCRRGLSVLARAVSRRAHGSWTTPGLMAARVIVPISVAFPLQAHGRRPNCVFRSSIPGPSMPLSTLHPAPRGTQRKTRGQDGSLLLSCGALSSPTARRFIPTIALADAHGSGRAATVREWLSQSGFVFEGELQQGMGAGNLQFGGDVGAVAVYGANAEK